MKCSSGGIDELHKTEMSESIKFTGWLQTCFPIQFTEFFIIISFRKDNPIGRASDNVLWFAVRDQVLSMVSFIAKFFSVIMMHITENIPQWV